MATPMVAIVDDDPIVVRVLQRLLQRAGYTIRTWCPGDDILQFITTTQPDTVILDLHIGRVSGWTIVHDLRRNATTAAVPVVICTGDAGTLHHTVAQLNELHCSLLEKPFAVQTVLDTIATVAGVPSDNDCDD
jgi:DNA-binding response OmpR family regulator